MKVDPAQLPDDIGALKAALAQVAAELASAGAKASDDAALITHQKLQIEKLKRELYGPCSERTSRILDQMELTFEELESAVTEAEIAAAPFHVIPHGWAGPSLLRRARCGQDDNGPGLSAQAPGAQAFPEHLPWSCQGLRLAFAVAAAGCASSERVSPRPWK